MEGKLNIGQVISRVFALFGSRFGSLLGLGLAVYAAIIALAIGFTFIGVLLVFGGGTLMSILMLVLVFYVVLIMTWGTYHATVIRIAQNAQVGRNERLGQAISVAFSRVGALILAEVLISICMYGPGLVVKEVVGSGETGQLLATLLLLFPGLYFAARFAVAVPILVIERKGAIESMERSWKLTANNTLRVFGVMLLFGIVAVIAFYLLVVAFISTGGGGSGAGRLLFVLINLVVIWPPLALLTAVIYFELRGPEPVSTVPTFGLPPMGAPGTIPAAGAFQPSVDMTQPPAEVSWDTSRSTPPPPPGS